MPWCSSQVSAVLLLMRTPPWMWARDEGRWTATWGVARTDAEPNALTDAEPDALTDAEPDALTDAEPNARTDAEPGTDPTSSQTPRSERISMSIHSADPASSKAASS